MILADCPLVNVMVDRFHFTEGKWNYTWGTVSQGAPTESHSSTVVFSKLDSDTMQSWKHDKVRPCHGQNFEACAIR